ncbi:M48 family metallopeptidase [Hyphomonas sp.]|uniref:M48 family metallopeptidase n=1 Tax=Hyphomonas sp. TaxID=87 RepID=UPI00391CF5A1
MSFARTALFGAAVMLAACSSTDQGARIAGARPTNLKSTEASLWYQMETFEKSLKQSGRTIKDPGLQARMSEMACQLSGDFCADLRVYVVRDPSFNASMAPNGMLLIHSGLLLRAETEDEVAFVLGHEFVHFSENHSMERYAAVRNANIAGSVVGSILGGAGAGSLSSLGYVAAFGGAFAFSREQELEADRLGLDQIRQAGFNPKGAPAIWKNLLTESEATSNRKKAKDIDRSGMFDTHPLIRERITFLESFAVGTPPEPEQRLRYRALIRPHLQEWLMDVIADGDHGASLVLVSRLMSLGEDLGALNYVQARIYMMRAEDGDKAKAEAALAAAATYADVPPVALRELGTLYRARGERAKAASSLREYLLTDPAARDRALIESQIIELEEAPI